MPSLASDRNKAGVVYQLRTDVHVSGQPNLAQLWIEPGTREVPAEDPNDPPTTEFITWPYVDAEIPNRTDYTMPVPHQYVIETVGSTRGNYSMSTVALGDLDSCPGDSLTRAVGSIGKSWASTESGITFEVSPASEASGYFPYPTDSAGYYTDRTPQIVGPHAQAKISFVRALGDVDGDGVRDFAVGSDQIEDPAHPGTDVGAIYIVYGRAVGLEGDYLLENLHVAKSDPSRLHGIMLKGSSSGERLARVFDDAGDFNGDGFDDVVVGNEAANSDTGEVVIILGSQNLESPVNGWTVDGIVNEGQAIRLLGEAAGDLAGSNVSGAGDVDGDGLDDVLIAAPGADSDRGAVYIIYGSTTLAGQVNLADVGTVDLPGAKLIGRVAGDELGGGQKSITGTMPGDPNGSFAAYSRGVSRLGDIDGDGRDDYAISAMLADRNGRVDTGEIYILYGRGD